MKTIVPSLLLGMLLLSSCDGGGGGGGGTPAQTTGTVSGNLIIPPNHSLEIEPNDTLPEAQPVSEVQKVAGRAALSDPGFALPAKSVQDLYRLEAEEPVRITLTVAANDLFSNDLDLILMDASGTLLDASEGGLSTEIVETPGAGIYLAGVRAVSGSSAYLLSLSPLGELESLHIREPAIEGEFATDEILVKLREQAPSATVSDFGLNHRLKSIKEYPRSLRLMRIATSPTSSSQIKLNHPKSRSNAKKARMIDQIRKLRRNPLVEYAEPNYIRKPLILPNDVFFGLQWNYPLINLPQAWDRTVGSTEVTAAVLDTGILPGHPDLQNRLTTGYDFISNPERANDGGGIDPDPTDPGDDVHGFSSFHGTHVAGIVAAETDNLAGVAGITWTTRLMPLRVLGVGGGTDADIAQAIRYAAGLSNSSGTLPDRPVDVINMSFGGAGISQTLGDAVQAARAAGVILAAAAGNDSNSTPSYPASYDGVLSVAAVDLASQRASYSNFGPQIDLTAPGGDMSRDLNSDGYPDGILSTIGDDGGNFLYRFLAGTSLAAPHVAGVVALMRGVNPSLSPVDIDRLIAGTHPETGIQITRDLGTPGRDDLYGHGLIDASKAILAAQEVPGGGDAVEPPSQLAISATVLDFDSYLTSLTFEISNAGGGVLNINDIATDQSWLSVIPTGGNAPLTVLLTVNRNGLPEGEYQATVTIDSDAVEGPATATVDVFMTVGEVVLGNVGPVFILIIDEANQQTVAEAETDFSLGYAFSVEEVPPGSYLVVAGTDRDEDKLICDIEDACGFFPDSLIMKAGADLSGIDFTVSELVSPQASSLAERIPLGNLRRLR